MQKNQEINTPDRTKESGSVIIWIMVMVTLFGALGYALSQGTRGGGDQLTDKQAELAANEVINKGRIIHEAIKYMLINGCDESEIDFDGDGLATIENTDSPSDGACDVYHANGGGIKSVVDGLVAYVDAIEGIGTTSPEIYLYHTPLSDQICNIVNNQLGNNLDINDLPIADISNNAFDGDLEPAGFLTHGDDGDEVAMAGIREACIVDSDCGGSGACNIYYKVMMEQ